MSHIAHTILTVITSRKINSWYRTDISASLSQSNLFDVRAMPNGCFKPWEIHS